MHIYELAIINPLGLHARPCAKLVKIVSRFRCNVSLVVKGRRASARSIVAVMLLGASFGATVRLEVDGPDEAVAMREIAELFQDGSENGRDDNRGEGNNKPPQAVRRTRWPTTLADALKLSVTPRSAIISSTSL